MALGDFAVDLRVLANEGLFDDINFLVKSAFNQPTLNEFMSLGKNVWKPVRARLIELLSNDSPRSIKANESLRSRCIFPQKDIAMHLPCNISDYTDFYSSLPHAFNVGRMFRGQGNELQPNYLHLPVGYHGRASSVVVSGCKIVRPCGQVVKDGKDLKQGSNFSECKAMDFELEMGVIIGPGNNLGEPIDVKNADDHVFGFVLLNDWSARDIQKFEYVPLGPFNGKNFATTISPWIVTKEALEPFRCPTIYHSIKLKDLDTKEIDFDLKFPTQLPYLQEPTENANMSYDIKLSVSLKTKEMDKYQVITQSNYKNMYWTHRQQVAHHTVTGCNMNPGDLLGSGTISGYGQGEFGSLLEITWNRKRALALKGKDGEDIQRFYLQDYDSVKMEGICESPNVNYKIGFGDCEGVILPATNKYLNKL